MASPSEMPPSIGAPAGRAPQALLAEAIEHHRAGRPDAAARLYREVLAVVPDDPDANHNLAILLAQRGAPWSDVLPLFRTAWALDPAHPQRAASFLQALARAGAVAEANRVHDECLRRGLGGATTAPGANARAAPPRTETEAQWQRAHALAQGGELEAADSLARAALASRPDWADAHLLAGQLAMRLGRLKEAQARLREAARLSPGSFQAHYDLGTACTWCGDAREAIDAYARAVEIEPGNLAARSTLHFAWHYAPDEDPAAALERARAIGALASASAREETSWRCDAAAPRLRVGFVSGDLGDHPVGYFLEALLPALASRSLDCIAFPTRVQNDPVAARLRRCFRAWRPLTGLRDEDAARLIHDEAPHVLLDLAGHTAGNRLGLFAWRAVPLQVSWLGDFGTTGLAQIDAVLTDAASTTASTQSQFVEPLWTLAGTRLCFTAPDAAPPVAPPPVLRRGHATFGSFQNVAKLNDGVLAAWSRVLAETPGSRLRVQNGALGDAAVAAALSGRMASAGIPIDRVDLLPGLARPDYFAAHGEVDLLLDTFPYPGGTTTCEALWMGVPTVTLAGATPMARQGASLMRAAGLPGWIADNADGYVKLAVDFARDAPSLATLRAGLRERVRASPLMDADRFAADFETVLREMWRRIGAPRLQGASHS